MKILYLLAHLTLCHWFTWLNITKNQNDTHIHGPKKHSQSKFYPSADDFTQALLVMLMTNITYIDLKNQKIDWDWEENVATYIDTLNAALNNSFEIFVCRLCQTRRGERWCTLHMINALHWIIKNHSNCNHKHTSTSKSDFGIGVTNW